MCIVQKTLWYASAEITSLVEDMHACTNKIIDMFSGKLSSDGPVQLGPDETLMGNPAKLSYVVKQALREAAVGKLIPFILPCDVISSIAGSTCKVANKNNEPLVNVFAYKLPCREDLSQMIYLRILGKHASPNIFF